MPCRNKDGRAFSFGERIGKWSLEFPPSAYALVSFAADSHFIIFYFAESPFRQTRETLSPVDTVAIETQANFCNGAFFGLVFNIDVLGGFAAVTLLVYPGILLRQTFPAAFLAHKGFVGLAIQPCDEIVPACIFRNVPR